jgi:hypothetical protein
MSAFPDQEKECAIDGGFAECREVADSSGAVNWCVLTQISLRRSVGIANWQFPSDGNNSAKCFGLPGSVTSLFFASFWIEIDAPEVLQALEAIHSGFTL